MNHHHSQYTLVRKLGEGGMGTVYLAEDILLERQVAIKELNKPADAVSGTDNRFQQEALALARLNHPAITHLYTFLPKDDTYWMVMEYVQGKTLEDWLRIQGPFSPLLATSILVQVLEGLYHAHRKGIIHRDLKPANIMISDEGEVKIMDFGIARIRNSQRITQHGKSVGTLEYMAPEQIQGLEGDERTDIYAAGNILYELLSGVTPFRSDTDYHLMKAKLEEKPPVLPAAVPALLQNAIYKALERQPDKRFNHAIQFRETLERTVNMPLLRNQELYQALHENHQVPGATVQPTPSLTSFTAKWLKIPTWPGAWKNKPPVTVAALGNRAQQQWKRWQLSGANKAVGLLVAVLLLCSSLLVWNHFRQQPTAEEPVINNTLPVVQTGSSNDTAIPPVHSNIIENQLLQETPSPVNTTTDSGEKEETGHRKKKSSTPDHASPEKPAVAKNETEEKETTPVEEPVTTTHYPARTASPATVPAGREISVTLDESLSSEEPGKDGKTVQLRCAENIEADGRVVIRKGAQVTGKIVDVVPSGGRKKALIGFVILKVEAVDGSSIRLHSDRFRLFAPGNGTPAIYNAGQTFRATLGRGTVR